MFRKAGKSGRFGLKLIPPTAVGGYFQIRPKKQVAFFYVIPLPLVGFRLYAKPYSEMMLAIKKAAPAAALPMNAVCSALRTGLIPVNRPFTNPKTNNAKRVTTMEIIKANDGWPVAM